MSKRTKKPSTPSAIPGWADLLPYIQSQAIPIEQAGRLSQVAITYLGLITQHLTQLLARLHQVKNAASLVQAMEGGAV